MSEPSSEHLIKAAASLSLAYQLIDRLGNFFQAEHALVVNEDGSLAEPLRYVDDQHDWVMEVNARLDYVGFAVPELYETLIQLAHSVEQILIAHTGEA